MSRLTKLSLAGANVWSTLREIDTGALRAESERAVAIFCYGSAPLIDQIATLLATAAHATATPTSRYGAVGTDPIFRRPFPLGATVEADIQRADLVLLVVDGNEPLSAEAIRLLEAARLSVLPLLVVVLHSAQVPLSDTGEHLLQPLSNEVVAIPDPHDPDAGDILADALLARLREDLHLAAARRLPGVRSMLAEDLLQSTSYTNATYALVSSAALQFPVLNLPIAAADMLILTKNQIMMIYKLALAHGAPPEFQANIREVLAVVGMGYLWRQVARTLVGLVPLIGIVPRVGVAYGGTYAVGFAAQRWFASGQIVSQEQLTRVAQQAVERSQHLLANLREQVDQGREQASTRLRQLSDRTARPNSDDQP